MRNFVDLDCDSQCIVNLIIIQILSKATLLLRLPRRRNRYQPT